LEIEVSGTTVADVLQALERANPRLAGWVLDEQGRIREHVAVFVNQERVASDAAVSSTDRLHVLPAISGGAGRAEILVIGGDEVGRLVFEPGFAGRTTSSRSRRPRAARLRTSSTTSVVSWGSAWTTAPSSSPNPET